MTQCTWVSARLSATFNLSDCGLMQHAADDKFYDGNCCWPPVLDVAKPEMASFHWSTVHRWVYTGEQQQRPQTLTGACSDHQSFYQLMTTHLALLYHSAAGHCWLQMCLLWQPSQDLDLEQRWVGTLEAHQATRQERSLCRRSPRHSPPGLTSRVTACRDERVHCCQNCVNRAYDLHSHLYKWCYLHSY